MIKNIKSQHSIIQLLIERCKTKNAKRGLKLLNKTCDISFMIALPALVSKAISQGGLVSDQSKEFNILVHSSIKHDCIDHYRWFALIPLILNRPDLKFNVVVTCSNENQDTQTKFRNVIDYMIVKELDNNFSSELVEGSISSVFRFYGQSYFDLVVNNIPSSQDISTQEDVEALAQHVNHGKPLVIADFSLHTILHRYNFFRLAGFNTEHEVTMNSHHVSFSKHTSTSYKHCGYFLLIDEFIGDGPVDFESIAALNKIEKSIVSRMDMGDSMNKLPSFGNEIVRIFDGVEIHRSNDLVRASFEGDTYSFICPQIQFPLREDSHTTNMKSDLSYWSLNTYSLIINEINSLKGQMA